MRFIHTREQYDEFAQQLIGFKLNRVTYYEIEYEIEEPCYLHLEHIGHFLDFGLEFSMTDGAYRSFLWDSTFYQYGIGIYAHQAVREVKTNRQWDVSTTRDWLPFVGSSITAVDVYWSWESESISVDEVVRNYYPQDIRIEFSSNQHIYLSASQYLYSSDKLSSRSDDILVIFDEAIALKYKIGPYATET